MNYAEFYRRSRKLTQEQLAKAAGTSQLTVSALERGARVDSKIMRALASFFQVPEHHADRLLDEVKVSIDGVPPAPDMRQCVLEARRTK